MNRQELKILKRCDHLDVWESRPTQISPIFEDSLPSTNLNPAQIPYTPTCNSNWSSYYALAVIEFGECGAGVDAQPLTLGSSKSHESPEPYTV